MANLGDTENLLKEFLGAVDMVYGLYLDTTTGFQYWDSKFREMQIEAAKNVNLTIDQLDKTEFIYGKGDPNIKATVLHKRTQGELKERIKKNGTDYHAIAAACLVMMYQYWDYYREKIASQLGVTKDAVKWDIMGDVNLLRRSIIHNRAVAIPEVKRCRILVRYKPGEAISITDDQMEEIVNAIKGTSYSI